MTELIKEIHYFKGNHHKQEFNGANNLLTQAADALEAAEKRIAEAVAILQTIEWVGSGAKGRIEDAIGVLLGIQEETE